MRDSPKPEPRERREFRTIQQKFLPKLLKIYGGDEFESEVLDVQKMTQYWIVNQPCLGVGVLPPSF